MEDKNTEFSSFETLDKDYGRCIIMGRGYGEFDEQLYAQFIELITHDSEI